MPYRRLPNTDNARLKALKTALELGKELPPFKLAYKQGTYQMVQTILPSYETALSEHKNSYALQIEKNKRYHQNLKKARLYISHFFQVINLSISRGDLPASTRTFFGLDEDDKKLPSLNTEEEISHWGQVLIDGENKRRMQGKSPITNPTIALVKVHYEKFQEAYNYQGSLKKRNLNAQNNLRQIRENADSLIQRLWNEVEDTYSELPEELRREKASAYGVVYVYRKNELSGHNLMRAVNFDIN